MQFRRVEPAPMVHSLRIPHTHTRSPTCAGPVVHRPHSGCVARVASQPDGPITSDNFKQRTQANEAFATSSDNDKNGNRSALVPPKHHEDTLFFN